jgi:hypothetical protein
MGIRGRFSWFIRLEKRGRIVEAELTDGGKEVAKRIEEIKEIVEKTSEEKIKEYIQRSIQKGAL